MFNEFDFCLFFLFSILYVPHVSADTSTDLGCGPPGPTHHESCGYIKRNVCNTCRCLWLLFYWSGGCRCSGVGSHREGDGYGYCMGGSTLLSGVRAQGGDRSSAMLMSLWPLHFANPKILRILNTPVPVPWPASRWCCVDTDVSICSLSNLNVNPSLQVQLSGGRSESCVHDHRVI